MIDQTKGCKPEIHYPCRWQYKLIGEDKAAMLAVIAEQVDLGACELTPGNVSSGGRYCSLNLELEVQSEAERMRLYQAFTNTPAIRVVL